MTIHIVFFQNVLTTTARVRMEAFALHSHDPLVRSQDAAVPMGSPENTVRVVSFSFVFIQALFSLN